MSFAQLRCFVAVAEELHFGRAAARLQMTQPPLSRQVGLLEQELGVVLIDRSHRAVGLTRAGVAFLDEARRLLHSAERATQTAQLVSAGQLGQLGIGFTAANAYRNLGGLLGLIRHHLPEVSVSLREMVTSAQLDAVSDGGLDIAMLRPPQRRADLDSLPLVTERFVAAVPADGDLDTPDLTIDRLDGRDVVMYQPPEARYFHDLVTRIFHDANVTPNFPYYIGQTHTMLGLVNSGLCAALVPEAATRLRYPNVRFRDIPLQAWARVEFSVVWRKDNENPALAAVIDLLRDDSKIVSVFR